VNSEFDLILSQIGGGETASPRLMELLYAELHAMAHHLMRQERGCHTLQPTALVHEAFLRLVDSNKVGNKGHLYFLDAAAATMRRVLVDHARTVKAQKRGGGARKQRITLRGIAAAHPDEDGPDDVDIAALDAALAELQQLDQRHARIVELRFFGGMSGDQIAEHLGISRRTVVRDLAFSNAWLQRRLKQSG